MARLSPRERLAMVLAGELPDRFLASAWRHYYHAEASAEELADAMLAHQRRYQFDFMKINPRADYHIEGWGFRQSLSKSEFEKHTKQHFPVARPEDWDLITPLPLTTPSLAEQLKAISLIRKRVGNELPLFMTIFTPLAIAGRMVPDQTLLKTHLSSHPEKIRRALAAITDTFARFASEIRNAGADGMFLATTAWASTDMLTWEAYQQFALPDDLRLLAAADSDATNILHVCGSNCMIVPMLTHPYPVRMFSYNAADPTNPPLNRTVGRFLDRIIVGGIDHDGWLLRSEPDEVRHLIHKLRDDFDPTRMIMAPGCTYNARVPHENLHAILEGLQ